VNSLPAGLTYLLFGADFFQSTENLPAAVRERN